MKTNRTQTTAGAALVVLLACAAGAADDAVPRPSPPAAASVEFEKHTLPATPALDKSSIYQLESVWTRSDSKKATLADLKGKVRVLAIFYSSCEYACPIIVGRMKAVRAALPPAARDATGFVLVSMDPEHDDPARLRDYAKRMELEGDWTLLHGSDGDVRELGAVLGFRFRQEKDGGFSHSNMITVLDREGRVSHQLIGLEPDVDEAVRAVTSLIVP